MILPSVFATLEGKVSFVTQITPNEFHCSCPACGGTLHEDGTGSDRFVLWIASRRGTPFGLCRKCGHRWSPDKADAEWTPEEREEFKKKVAELEKAYFEKKAQDLKLLSQKIEEQGVYIKYYEEGLNSEFANQYYEKIWMPPTWREYLKKGFIREYKVHGSLSTYFNPAFTFPVWTLGSRVENVKIRVAQPTNSNDRYRNLYKSGCQHLYIPVHEAEKISGKVIIMEGEKKADAAQIWGELSSEFQVIGVQSSMPEKRILKQLSDSEAEVFYLAFDPDAYTQSANGVAPVLNTAKQLGESRCRLVIPPRDTKFDDSIIAGFRFSSAVNMSIRPSNL